MMNYYDIIVIGAGIEGSATAMHCATDGAKTLLLEQFEIGHTRGSSTGGTRIIRKAYTNGFYTKMMLDAYNMWGEIERDTGNIKLIEQTGGLYFIREGTDEHVQTVASLSKHNVAYQVYSASETKQHYPYTLIPSNYISIFEPSTGVVYARKALQAIQRIFESRGGVLLDRHKVINIIPSKMGLVTVDTERGTFTCGKLILCAGPWTNKLTEPLGLKLPLTTKRIAVTFWQKLNSITDKFIVHIYFGDNFHIYSMPDTEYPGLFKICYHDGLTCDPDNSDLTMNPEHISLVSNYIRDKFQGISTKPSIIEKCIYTMTPDSHPILDYHPQYPNIIIGAGFSGHGFKLAPIIGRMLATLAIKKQPETYDISHFRLSRFQFPNAKL